MYKWHACVLHLASCKQSLPQRAAAFISVCIAVSYDLQISAFNAQISFEDVLFLL